MVKINRNIIIETNPNKPIFPNEIAQGNKKAISKSKIINNIATDKTVHQTPYVSH